MADHEPLTPDEEFRQAMAHDRRVKPLRGAGARALPTEAARTEVAVVPTVPVAPPPAVALPPERACEAAAPVPATPPAPDAEHVQRLRDAEAERDALRQHVAALTAQLQAARERLVTVLPTSGHTPSPQPNAVTLWDTLDQMAFDDPVGRMADVLQALRNTPAGRRLVQHLTVRSASELGHILRDKVAWVCDRCIRDAGEAIPIAVPPDRCEYCGGSSVHRAAQRFLATCLRHACRRLLVVGGSPTYHAVLQRELPHQHLELRIIEGDRKLGGSRAAALVTWCDRGFVWGPTMLDHAVSRMFTGPHIHTVQVRGITQFLEQAAEWMSGVP